MTSYDESIEVLDGEEIKTPKKEEKEMSERRPRTAKLTSANLRPPPSNQESRPTSRRTDTMEADERNLSPETTDVEGEEEEEESPPPQLDGEMYSNHLQVQMQRSNDCYDGVPSSSGRTYILPDNYAPDTSTTEEDDEGFCREELEAVMRKYTGPNGMTPLGQEEYPVEYFEGDDKIYEFTTAQEEEEFVSRKRKLREIQLERLRNITFKRLRALSPTPGVFTTNRAYNPNDYEGLNVSPEVREIFGYIQAYTPADTNGFLDVKLKPFIPEYYPSVGDIDGFIKVLDEDLFDEALGVKYLDEASTFQSDPSVLDLRLRSMAKQSSAKAALVKKVENVAKNGKVIENWIKDISDLHRSKPSPSVYYSKPMPELDGLLEEWPPEVEEAMAASSLPPPNIQADLNTYVDIVCGLLDIPVYKSRIQSLHLLATLYSTMKRMNEYENNNSNNNMNQSVDRLEF